MNSYVVASSTIWPFVFDGWHYITTREELTLEYLREIKPRYVFFPHWSWKVPDEITSEFECVCFHMTALPYGRGGSPLQNLIERGHKHTRLTALRMVSEIDAGPMYIQVGVDLSGSAKEIYDRVDDKCVYLMGYMCASGPTPIEQEGAVTYFTRRTPEQSLLPQSLDKIYDHIRMLDAPGYPKAFIEYGDMRMEFTDAVEGSDGVVATVAIT